MGLGFWVSGLGLGSRVYEFRFLGLGYLGFREFQGLEFWGLSTGQCGLGFWAVWFGGSGVCFAGSSDWSFCNPRLPKPLKNTDPMLRRTLLQGPLETYFLAPWKHRARSYYGPPYNLRYT